MDAAGTGPLGVTGAVLAGGRSTRMGRDKALLAGPDGRPLVVRALDALASAGCGPLLVSARGDEPDLARVVGERATLVVDRVADEGPLGGLAAVLEASATEWALVVACDMPRLDPRALAAVARAALAAPPSCRLVCPRAAGRPQPLHAAWRRAVAPAIRARLEAGRRRVLDLVTAAEPLWLEDPGLDGWDAAFTNWNTPGDVADRGP